MYNMFLHEKRQKLAEDQVFHGRSNKKYKEHLIKNFEKRLDKFIDYTIANPMEPVNTFLLNESFVKHKTNHGYKTHLGDKNAPSFKTGFYQPKKDLNNSCIEKLETPLIGPIVGKPFEFRKRQVSREIQPGMRFRNKRIDFNYYEKPNTSFSHGADNVGYEPISQERGVIGYGVESKKSTGRGRFSYSSCSSSVISSENMPQKEIPKKNEIGCGNWLPLKSVLTRAIDAYGPGKLRERSQKTMQQNYSFVEEDKGDKSELDDSMLTGIDFLGRSRMIKSAYNPDRAMSVPKARTVLKTANLLK